MPWQKTLGNGDTWTNLLTEAKKKPAKSLEDFHGAYHYNFSDVLQDVTAPLIRFDDETGVEAWYAIALTANADLTLNAQFIDPAAGLNDDALLLGARLGLHF